MLLEQEGPCGSLGHQGGNCDRHEKVIKRKVTLGYKVRDRDEELKERF